MSLFSFYISIFSKTARFYLLITILPALFFFPCAVKSEDRLIKTVTIIEASSIFKDNIEGARSQAISKSLISAINIVALDILPVESLINEFKMINTILYSDTGQYIKGFKVMAESKYMNKYRMIVQVDIYSDLIREKLTVAGLFIEKKSLPKILFLIWEQDIENILPLYWWGEEHLFVKGSGETGVSEAMSKAGFMIMSHKGIISGLSNDSDIKSADYYNFDIEDADAVKLGIRYMADVVVTGKSLAQKTRSIMGNNIETFKGTVSIRALRTDTGEEIGIASGVSISVSSSETQGWSEALENAGRSAGRELGEKIIISWQKKIKTPTMVEIIVKGTGNLSNFVKFRSILSKTDGVKNIRIEEIKSGEAVIMADYSQSAKELANSLIKGSFEGFAINIYEVTDDQLKIILLPE